MVLVGLNLGCLAASGDPPGTSAAPLFQLHFTGSAHLAKGTNATKLSGVLGLPATAELRSYTWGKLAKAGILWTKPMPAEAGDQSALLGPLLDDLVQAESYAEARGPVGQVEGVLAIELNQARAALWSTNLWRLTQAWKWGTPAEIASGTFRGWGLRRTGSPGLVQVVRAENWLLVGVGGVRLELLPALAQQISKSGRPVASLNHAVLEAEADFPRLGAWFPSFAKYRLPHSRMVVTGNGEGLRTEVRMRYADGVPWTVQPWKIPTALIRDPLISFTVGQGIGPILGKMEVVQELGLKTLPDQFCLWGQGYETAHTFLTVPMEDSSNVVQKLAPVLPRVMEKHLTNAMGNISWNSNKADLAWRELPFIAPHMRPVRSGQDEFVFAELFPLAPHPNPAPAELMAQINGRKDLVYYDWELTQARLSHAKQFYQLFSIIMHRRGISPTAPTEKWLAALTPYLGNTVTEVSKTSPNELTLVRKSYVGLTAFELVTLARWIDSPGFPFRFEAQPTFTRQVPSQRITAPKATLPKPTAPNPIAPKTTLPKPTVPNPIAPKATSPKPDKP